MDVAGGLDNENQNVQVYNKNGKINYAGLTGNVKTDKSILNWCG